MWTVNYSYYTVMKEVIKETSDKIENRITLSHFSKDVNISLSKSLYPFDIYVYSYIHDEKKLLYNSSDKYLVSNKKSFIDGFHVVSLPYMQGQQYLEYSKSLQIGKHKYHIVILKNMQTYTDIQMNIFLWVLLLVGFIYIMIFVWEYKYCRKLISPIYRMIEMTSSLSRNCNNFRLELPTVKDEFYTLTESINTVLERLDNTLMQTKRFNAKVSHELRTPLTILRVEMEMSLYRQRSVEEYKELVHSSLEEVDNIQAIIDNMLLLSKLDFNTLNIKKMYVRLDKIVEEVITSSYIQANTKKIEIVNELDQVNYLMEETLMKQSIKNIVNNAIKYSPVGSSIIVKLRKDKSNIFLSIKDEGYGISSEDLEHIFEVHYRSDAKELDAISGEGLGLSIVSHCLQIHQATMDVKSTVGEGSTFTIKFKY